MPELFQGAAPTQIDWAALRGASWYTHCGFRGMHLRSMSKRRKACGTVGAEKHVGNCGDRCTFSIWSERRISVVSRGTYQDNIQQAGRPQRWTVHQAYETEKHARLEYRTDITDDSSPWWCKVHKYLLWGPSVEAHTECIHCDTFEDLSNKIINAWSVQYFKCVVSLISALGTGQRNQWGNDDIINLHLYSDDWAAIHCIRQYSCKTTNQPLESRKML